MSFRKIKTNSNCVGNRHHSGTTKFIGDINSEGQNYLFGHRSPNAIQKSL